jgi:hypothetical protein
VTVRLLTRQYKCDSSKPLYRSFYDMQRARFGDDASLAFLNMLEDYP